MRAQALKKGAQRARSLVSSLTATERFKCASRRCPRGIASHSCFLPPRPYFDVEPRDVFMNLAGSFRCAPPPRPPLALRPGDRWRRPRAGGSQLAPGDLYGPLMLAFTLAGLLIAVFKGAEAPAVALSPPCPRCPPHPHGTAGRQGEGTIMGHAFGLAFT